MGCSSGRIPCHPPAGPVLHHSDLDCSGGGEGEGEGGGGGSSDGPFLTQDGEDGHGGGDGETVNPPTAAPESHPTLERLAQATGGTEKSWYRCVFPFGVISLVIGVAGTGVTFTFDTLRRTKVVSVVLLVVGVAMLLTAAVCWRTHRLRRRRKKEGGFFCSEQGTL